MPPFFISFQNTSLPKAISKAFPNPATDIFHLEYNKVLLSAKAVTVDGRSIDLQFSNNRIDVAM